MTRGKWLVVFGSPGLIVVLFFAFLIGSLKLSQYRLQDIKPVSGIVSGDLADVRGQIHVHCYRSHDSQGTIEEIIQAAKSAGVGWVILTDHPSRRWEAAELNYPIQRDSVLIIFGRENSGRQGRYLTAPLREADSRLCVYSYLEKWFELAAGSNWDAVEIVNLYTNIRQKPQRLLRGYEGLCYVLPQNIRYWQMISERRGKPVPIVAATDAHSNFNYLGIRLDPYDLIFKLVSTHVLLDVGAGLTEKSVIQAIKKGRTYVAFDYLADSTGFQFIVKKGQERFLMGDAAITPDELAVKVPLAQDSEIRIFKDSNLVLRRKNTKEAYIFNPGPGFWRVEIWKDGYPWIISGQILVKSEK